MATSPFSSPSGSRPVGTSVDRYVGQVCPHPGRPTRDYWRKGVTEPGAELELLDVALGKLRALRLVADLPGAMVVPLPAIARYAVDAPTIRSGKAR
ncbi:DUF2398 family protein [Alloactinosynnema sp. L-07]|uniref:DUF2398 family protein n=1 Tax=Alloactinosynnema sp. L-07 TaxID=1653480 RepID=UPI001E2CF19A|nr:DUF2398 family protein [Alloactinosynnema sp. L-07]